MNRDEIIRMAREAGSIDSEDVIETVYAAFAAAEREACAKVCEQYDDDGGAGETWGPRFADAIRARGSND